MPNGAYSRASVLSYTLDNAFVTESKVCLVAGGAYRRPRHVQASQGVCMGARTGGSPYAAWHCATGTARRETLGASHNGSSWPKNNSLLPCCWASGALALPGIARGRRAVRSTRDIDKTVGVHVQPSQPPPADACAMPGSWRNPHVFLVPRTPRPHLQDYRPVVRRHDPQRSARSSS
jgi:hypothetical protein